MRRPLEAIPGVGPRIARSMESLGIREVPDLRGRKPEELFPLDCLQKGFREDRCALYVWRCMMPSMSCTTRRNESGGTERTMLIPKGMKERRNDEFA